MIWTGHIARIGEKMKVCKILVRKPKERDHSGDADVDRITLKWILEKLGGGQVRTIINWFGIMGICVHGNELSG
jgi:hypothetical protein